MRITSKNFTPNGVIPNKFTCNGENVNPELEFEDVPAEAKSLALVIEDPDAPKGTWTHWLVWNINSTVNKLEENSVPLGAVQGLNSARTNRYGGPCPPSGTHHYHFKLYALDRLLELPADADRSQLGQSVINHFIAQAELIGICSHD